MIIFFLDNVKNKKNNDKITKYTEINEKYDLIQIISNKYEEINSNENLKLK